MQIWQAGALVAPLGVAVAYDTVHDAVATSERCYTASFESSSSRISHKEFHAGMVLATRRHILHAQLAHPRRQGGGRAAALQPEPKER